MATRPLRRLTLLLAAFVVAVLSCGREAGGPTAAGRGASVRYARAFAIQPVFPPILAQAGGAAGLVAFDHVHLVLLRADGTVALDTVVTFPPGADQVTLTLTVPLSPGAPATGEPLALTMDYVNAAGVTVFHGGPLTVTAVPSVPGQPPPPPVTIPVSYTGPGAGAARVVIVPRSLTAFEGDGFTFTAVATDGGGTPIPGTPIVWTSLDPALATITSPGAGAGVAQSVRGIARIVAQLLTGPTDNVTVQVLLRARAIAAQSGGGQSATVGAQLAQPLVASVTASDGVGVGGVTVTFAVASGGGSVGTASAITDASGLAQSTWTLGSTVGAQTVTASVAGLVGSPVTFSATGLVAVPTTLVVTTQPVSTTAGAPLAAVVLTAKDAVNTTATAFTGPVSIALGANPGGATLGGTVTVNAVAGVATFATLSVNKVGTGYTLVASSAGLPSVTTSAFDIAAGPGNRLAFGAYPVAGAVAGVTIDPITVLTRDIAGNLATTFNGAVTLAVGTGPAGATLHGVTTKTAANGVATFDAVSLTTAGFYTLLASATGVASASGPAFPLAAGPAAGLVLVSGGGQSAAGSTTLAQPVVVQVTDAFGNAVVGAGRGVTFAVVTGGGTVGTPSATTTAAGQASTTWTLGAAAGAQSISASSAGLSTLTVGATATSGGTQVNYTWTGATSISWTDPTNWSPVGVPTASDSVYISSTVNRPTITTPVSVKHLVVVACGNVDNFNTLTVSGHLIDNTFCSLLRAAPPSTLQRPSAANAVLQSGTIILSGTGNLQGSFTGPMQVTGGVRTLVGSASVGVLTVSGTAQLDLGGHALYANSFETTGSGTLKMQNPADNFTDYGDATFGGGDETGLLTNGFLSLHSNFTQGGGSPAAFAASGSHTTQFHCCGQAIVSFANPGSTASTSHFAKLDFCNGEVGTTLHTDVYVVNTLTKACSGIMYVYRDASLGASVFPTLHIAGANVNTAPNSYGFERVRVAIEDGATITAFNNAWFDAFTSTTGETQFEVHRSGGGPFTFDGLKFSTPFASTSNYAGVFGPITVNLTNTRPPASAVAGKFFTSGGGTLNWTPATPVAAGLVFTTSPVTTVAGVSITPAIVVEARDYLNVLVATFTGNVTLAFGANPGGSTLSGTLTVAAVGGVATFSNISLNHANTGYRLVASSGALTPATSAAFAISAGAATTLTISGGNLQSGFVSAMLATPLSVTVNDALANVVPGVTVNWAAVTGGGSVSAPTSVTNASGVATITWTLGSTPGPNTATATVSGLAGSPALFSSTGSAFLFASVTTGQSVTCGLSSLGGAYCWGWNASGQLGDGTTTDHHTEAPVLGGLVFSSLSESGSTTCGLTPAGTAYCWGNGFQGELGNGVLTFATTPTAVLGGLTFSNITVGFRHVCALTPAGAAYCWGYNGDAFNAGGLGDGTNITRSMPVPVSGGLMFASLTAGLDHTCGVTPAGVAYCWGLNNGAFNGRLGDGTTIDRTSPTPVAGGLMFVSLAAFGSNTCGVTTLGAAYCWGNNSNTQLGNGTPCCAPATSPVPVSGSIVFASITGGNGSTQPHVCGLDMAGAAWCWGSNANTAGALGDNTLTDRSVPTAVVGGHVFTSLRAGFGHTCGLTAAGALWCWGSDGYGELGDGTTAFKKVPTLVIP